MSNQGKEKNVIDMTYRGFLETVLFSLSDELPHLANFDFLLHQTGW